MFKRDLRVVMRPIESVLAAVRNPRTHSKKQIRKIADSIRQFGFVTPILIGPDGRIVAGHGRAEAAKLLGLTEVPTLQLNLSPTELRAYAIADNEIAAQAGWDRQLLAIELAEIELLMPELDLTITGFELEDIRILRDVAGSKESSPDPAEEPLPTGPPVTLSGDLWQIGHSRLLCGDALSSESYKALLADEVADLVITDPPFNVKIAGHVTSQTAHREFAMASGELSRAQFQRFLDEMCRLLVGHSRSGSLHYIFMDWRSIADLIASGEAHFNELLNVIVWMKSHGAGMGSFYRSHHELVALFRNGRRRHINNVELGANGRNRTNVWKYPGASGAGPDRALSKLHPTVKNCEMIEEAIRDASDAGNIVLDPFGGSGTTLIAAQRTGRRARLIELDPIYCDVCVRRALGEGLAVSHADTGASFDEVRAERSSGIPDRAIGVA